MISTKDQLVVNVFGKEGCAKCAMLKQRLEKFLKEPEYAAFKLEYSDVLTDDGLQKFCLAECLNPSRIPAMVISKEGADGRQHYVPNPHPGKTDDVCKKSQIYTYLGLQTDYSEEGKGLLTPNMIKAILDEALAIEN